MWNGIRFLKKGKSAIPINIKSAEGSKATMKNRSEEAAKFLGTHIWGKPANFLAGESVRTPLPKIVTEPVHINESEITLDELMTVIRKLKKERHQAQMGFQWNFLKKWKSRASANSRLS